VDFAQQRYPKAVTTGIFATSFGGYITLLALEELPPDVKIVLRAPAVNMKKTFESSLMDLSMDKFKENGQVEIGFGRKVQVSYGFYEDLCQNDISTIDFNKEMLIIHGGKDTVVLPEDIQWFHAYNPRSRLKTIWCADHLFRYKNSLDEAVEDAANWILGI
jgi:hypothetical protein